LEKHLKVVDKSHPDLRRLSQDLLAVDILEANVVEVSMQIGDLGDD